MSKFFDATQRASGVTHDIDVDMSPDQNAADAEETGADLSHLDPHRVTDSGAFLGVVDTVVGEPMPDTDTIVAPASVPGRFLPSTPTIEDCGTPYQDEAEEGGDRGGILQPGIALHPAYERVVQRLLAYRRTPRQSVILVAAAVHGEGASTIARNTAMALARHRTERILLVDANTRNPSQHVAFDTGREDGLSDVILGSVNLTSAVRTDVGPGLSLITAGRAIESPTHLLTQSAMQGIVMALTSLYDWVIVDGPAVTVNPEAASLAAVSGGAVLVVQAEHTRREVVEEATKVLDESGVDVVGAVLNRRKYHIPAFVYKRL